MNVSHLWLFAPLPVSFPTPSLVCLITADALLCGVLYILALFVPSLRPALGFSFFMQAPLQWLIAGLSISLVGLLALALTGTLSQLPLGFLWVSIVVVVLTVLRVAWFSYIRPAMRHE